MTGTLTGQEQHHPKRRPMTEEYEPFNLGPLYNTTFSANTTTSIATNTTNSIAITTLSNNDTITASSMLHKLDAGLN